MSDIIKNNLPLLFRQLLLLAGGALVARGILTPEQLQQLLDPLVALIVGVAIAGGTMIYQYVTHPSMRAREAAKAIDETLPADAPAIIKTPEGLPDIPIPPKAAAKR